MNKQVTFFLTAASLMYFWMFVFCLGVVLIYIKISVKKKKKEESHSSLLQPAVVNAKEQDNSVRISHLITL